MFTAYRKLLTMLFHIHIFPLCLIPKHLESGTGCINILSDLVPFLIAKMNSRKTLQ